MAAPLCVRLVCGCCVCVCCLDRMPSPQSKRRKKLFARGPLMIKRHGEARGRLPLREGVVLRERSRALGEGGGVASIDREGGPI